ncbi:P-loop containing nucleoside triphosphate hydrolase protein [Piptocephalis cylindrospora]|uniref:P-loop containing nucleoside triphosphate hydrolase protein n=1 Tax=Piptocephalis cylindrospora TaxID=1907219 RepID=A0A4P9Y0S7_9FUNG|nr:P-loop containing nucleoside triphosphate hydrolase protein [Piptocephalis cylindrospora]|eukprot:RKP11380.1 P-loop containing nucleoside triphosphate hydrolase protein [Piptocephalis cylindrospora]
MFNPVSFTLDPGDRLVIRGPSGVGKTTLLKGLAGLLALDEGEVTLDGRTALDWGIPYWRAQVLYVPQRPALLPGTPWEFWEMVIGFCGQRKRENEEGARLHREDPRDMAMDLGVPEKLWSRPWTSLSGGEGQRILLSIALALNPPILLLDEPTSALDSASCALVEEVLQERSFICISHDPNQAERLGAQILRMSAPSTDEGESEEDLENTMVV